MTLARSGPPAQAAWKQRPAQPGAAWLCGGGLGGMAQSREEGPHKSSVKAGRGGSRLKGVSELAQSREESGAHSFGQNRPVPGTSLSGTTARGWPTVETAHRGSLQLHTHIVRANTRPTSPAAASTREIKRQP